jgi:hypothetical protein
MTKAGPTGGALLLLGVLCAFGSGRALAADRFVSTAGSDGANDCLVSTTPCRTMGHGVAQATSGDVVKIASGRYNESLLIDASVTLTLSGSWDAGFAGRDPSTYGSKLFGALQTSAGLGETLDVTVDGFTIIRSTGVSATSTDDGVLTLRLVSCAVKRNPAGSVFAESSGTSTLNLEVVDSLISANHVPANGGGIAVWTLDTSTLTLSLSGSTVERTRGTRSAPAQGVKASYASVSATDSRVERHRSAGVYLYGCPSVSLTGMRISRNSGGIRLVGGTMTLANSVVARNRGNAGVGAQGALTIVNSTIRDNGVYCSNVPLNASCSGGIEFISGTLSISNTISWGNRNRNGVGEDLAIDAAVGNVDHSDIGSLAGTYNDLGGNIASDPLLTSRRDDHLTAGSPAIDTGTCVGAPAVDFEGDPRPTGGGCDMGADEFVP